MTKNCYQHITKTVRLSDPAARMEQWRGKAMPFRYRVLVNRLERYRYRGIPVRLLINARFLNENL